MLLWARAQQSASHARRAGVYTGVWSVPKVNAASPVHPLHFFPRCLGPWVAAAEGRWVESAARQGRRPQLVGPRWLWAGPRGGRGGTETPARWGVWPLRPGGKRAPRPPVARAPSPAARDGLPLVSCRLLGKLVLLLSDSSPQTLGPGRALAAGDGRHEIRARNSV